MAAFSVNAYYDSSRNSLYIPAGIMQPPFFYPFFRGTEEARTARNYGGIGSIMGHEFTHGFDNQGAKFDADALRRDWWSNATHEEFDNKTQCMRRLYDGLVFQDIATDGKKTLGENIADHGGLKVALRAFRKRIHDENPLFPTFETKTYSAGRHAPPSAGDELSADTGAVRLFFVSFGQLWCSKARRNSGFTHFQHKDPHPPGPFRTNAAVSQNPDFAKAFRCPLGSAMNPINKCQVW